MPASQKSIMSFFPGTASAGSKKRSPSSSSASGKENDKKAEIEKRRIEALAKLKRKSPSESTTSIDLVGYFPRNSWHEALAPEFAKPYFKQLDAFLTSQYRSKTVFPPEHQIFEAFRLCDLDRIKVVIIGQDPYHGRGQGHGVCFSVQRGIRPPPSLKNIYKELKSDLGLPVPSHGYLKKWADQGVLLLNAVLTVISGQANSHRKRGWETFTDAVIALINKKCENVVFLCWGKPAQVRAKNVSRTRHCIIESSHPSPLGATKTAKPFIGSKCFSRANDYLKKQHGADAAIDWKL